MVVIVASCAMVAVNMGCFLMLCREVARTREQRITFEKLTRHLRAAALRGAVSSDRSDRSDKSDPSDKSDKSDAPTAWTSETWNK